MEPLSATSSIIAILQLSAKVLTYLNDVKDASKDRAQCAIEASNMHNLLTNLRFRLEGSSKDPWYTSVQALAVENGPLDQFKLALEMLQAKMTDGTKLNKIGKVLMWSFSKEEIKVILGRMERLKTVVEIALEMDHFKISQALKEDTTLIRTNMFALQSGIDAIQQSQDDAKHGEIVNWISPSDYPAKQSDFMKFKQEGTCQWFLDAPEVAEWLSGPNKTLFCPGIPGAGKTVVTAIAIDYLLNSVQSSSIGVAYVYYNYKSQDEDIASTIAAILKQLVQPRPSLTDSLRHLHTKCTNQRTKPSLDEISDALREVLKLYSKVYLVIDALDECPDGARRQLLARLRSFQTVHDLRLMATSRFIPEIMDRFKDALQMEVLADKEDVKRFVAGQKDYLPGCIQRHSALLEMVQDKIADAVEGMFLLARLHTDSLKDKMTPKAVKTSLETLSKGSAALDDAYEKALQRIKGQMPGHSETARKVLMWITYARRPLTTAELCCALAVEPYARALDPENRPEIEDLVSVCAGLVVIDPKSGIIRLVHYTTQDYLERIGNAWDPRAKLHIALTCLHYLSYEEFKSGTCSTDEEFKERLHRNEFLGYTAAHWGDHARAVDTDVADLACSFLLNYGLLSCAVQVASRSDFWKYGSYTDSAVHHTAQLGLCETMQKLLLRLEEDATIAVNSEDMYGRTPLFYAAHFGFCETAKLLISKGAIVNSHSARRSALFSASVQGHEQVVKLLLVSGANALVRNEDGLNALLVASQMGHERIVQLLLDAGTDIHVKDDVGRDPLFLASEGGHDCAAKLLLDRGADINGQDTYKQTALFTASYGGHERVVKLLLDVGADVNVANKHGWNALLVASQQGYERVVKLLLEAGANLHIKDMDRQTALIVASKRGHEQVVKLLLVGGADVHARDICERTALLFASAGGYERVVKLLLDAGADVHAEDENQINALHVATDAGHEQVVKLLLKTGADVHAREGSGCTAIDIALERGSESIVELLRNAGAIESNRAQEHVSFS